LEGKASERAAAGEKAIIGSVTINNTHTLSIIGDLKLYLSDEFNSIFLN